jgi:AraC-like DNA-binding protein
MRLAALATSCDSGSKMDVLSKVLSAIRLSGSVFFDVTASEPWVAEAPPSAQIADAVMPGAQHAIEYHVVTRGNCWITLFGADESQPVALKEGDIAVIPHGEPHAVSSKPGLRAPPVMEIHRRPDNGVSLPFALTTGSGGSSDAHLICGFFACDLRPFNPLLGSLPRLLRVGREDAGGAGGLLEQFVCLATAEAGRDLAGRQSVLNRLSELMFIEAIRLYMNKLAAGNTGWLAGLRDPLVGRALSLLHARPAWCWTLEGLAEEAGTSRSALSERFTKLVGLAPIQYLTRWRMQLAAKQLIETSTKIASVAEQVGYESEAAFSRAFKKYSGQWPGEWRSDRRSQALDL